MQSSPGAMGPQREPRFVSIGIPELAIAALVSVLALVALRPVGLNVPYWWDAGAVYAPGSQWLAQHGFDARPGVFPSDLGRGHSPLFYLFTALFFRVFGPGPVVGHAIVFGFSVMTLAFTYALGARLYGRPAGIVAALLLAISPLYLTMSSELLPEIPLTALTIAAIYAFACGRHGWSTAIAVVLVLMKETGLACPFAIMVATALDGARRHDLRSRVRQLGLTAIPVLALAAFYVWQRVVEGWWVTPYHRGLFEQQHASMEQFRRVASSICTADGRGIALAAAVIVIAYRLVRDRASLLRGAEAEPATRDVPTHAAVVVALVLVVLVNVAFFTTSFFLERYTLPAHPGAVILIAGILVPERFFARRSIVMRAFALTVIASTWIVAFRNREAGTGYASGETTFRYMHAVRALQGVIGDLETRARAPVILTTWPVTDALRFPYLGWVRRPYRALNLDWYLLPGRDRANDPHLDGILVLDEIGGADVLRREARRLGLTPRLREQVGGAHVEYWE